MDEAEGMTAKSEFVTPWGVWISLVCALMPRCGAAHPAAADAPGTSITRAMILLQIPDVETGRSVTLEKLLRRWTGSVPEEAVRRETDRLIADRLVILPERAGCRR